MFGYVNDNDEALVSKAAGKFGLNTGNITLLAFVTDAGKDKTAGNAVDIHFTAGGKEYRRRMYEVTGNLYSKSGEQIDSTHAEYAEAHKVATNQVLAVITHAVKAVGVTDEQLQKALSVPGITTFADWCRITLSLVPTDYQTRLVDGFVQYQYSITQGQDKTFLELPKNMKQGRFLSPHIVPVGVWEEVRDVDGLSYKDSAGNIHPFIKTASFLASDAAIQKTTKGSTTAAGNAMNAKTAPAPSTWK